MDKIIIISDHIVYHTPSQNYTSATVLNPNYKNFETLLFSRIIDSSFNSSEIKNLNILPNDLEVVGYQLKRKGGLGYILSIKDIGKNLLKHIKKCDLVILKMPYFSSILAIFICRILKKKYVLYFIGFGGKNLASKNKPIVAKILDLALQHLVKYSPYNIFVSYTLKNSFKKTNKSIVLPEIDTEKFKKIPTYKKSRLVDTQDLVIGYLGRFSEEKGVDDLPKILEGLSFVSLELIGDGSLKTKILDSLATHDIDFCYHGWVKNGSDLFNIISKWDVMLIPSKTEGFGLVVIEGNLCGIPVIANSVGGLKDIVTNDRNGYLVNSAKESRDKIIQLYSDKDKLYNLSLKSRKHADDFLVNHNYQYELGKFLDEIVDS